MADIAPDPSPAANGTAVDLASLRAQLDGLDDALHALLMQRAAVVTQVGRLAGKGPVKLRPGREAAILRRLLARHEGAFPPSALLLMWRQMINGMTALQAPFLIAVCDPDPGGTYTSLAHEHFGALTPLRVHRTPAQAIGAIRAGTATAAVLPLPTEWEAEAAAWWTALLHRDDPRVHVVARLPFWSRRPEGAAQVQALVVSIAPPDPSGQDRSLLGLEIPREHSRQRLAQSLAASGFEAGQTILRRDAGGEARVLVDVAGFVAEDDPRLAALGTPVVLGAYSLPIEGAAAS